MEKESCIISQVDYNRNSDSRSVHMAGIIPIEDDKHSVFGLPWHDCLMPISKHFVLIERAILEAYYAGCTSIWLVCDEDVTPFIKRRTGEWVRYTTYQLENKPAESKRVPIYYLPIAKKRLHRNNLPYRILYGMMASYWVSWKLSSWVLPTKFYVCSPMSVYPTDCLRYAQNRDEIKRERNVFFLSFKDEIASNKGIMGFSIHLNNFLEFRQNWKNIYGEKIRENNKTTIKFEDVFTFSNMSYKKRIITELPWMHHFRDFDDYINFLASENRKNIIEDDNLVRGKNIYRQSRGYFHKKSFRLFDVEEKEKLK